MGAPASSGTGGAWQHRPRDVNVPACMQAGTYGVLVLFGVMPAAMVYSERSWGSTISAIRVMPGGTPLMVAVGGTAAAIIGNEVVHAVLGVQQ